MSPCVAHWDRQYRSSPAWDTGRPSSELCRILGRFGIKPCRAIELGCGTGASAVYLARRGFAVTAVDLSPRAIGKARERARAARVSVRFLACDLADARRLGGPFDFFFDCGCYGAVRRRDGSAYLTTLEQVLSPGALGLVLTGNAAEPEDEVGPPGVRAKELREEFGGLFIVMRLRPFRFDPCGPDGRRFLGWSCLLRRGTTFASGEVPAKAPPRRAKSVPFRPGVV
jgi:SAM-dependent methyltransferase